MKQITIHLHLKLCLDWFSFHISFLLFGESKTFKAVVLLFVSNFFQSFTHERIHVCMFSSTFVV